MCAMAVVHAVLDSARDIHLWAEDLPLDGDGPARAVRPAFLFESGGSDHPFAARSVSIEAVAGPASDYRLADPGLALTLPTDAGGPLPSTWAWAARRRRHHVDGLARANRLPRGRGCPPRPARAPRAARRPARLEHPLLRPRRPPGDRAGGAWTLPAEARCGARSRARPRPMVDRAWRRRRGTHRRARRGHAWCVPVGRR